MIMTLQLLIDGYRDCARAVLSHLTRRQALLASLTCKGACELILEMLEHRESPFRQAMVVACSQPGRLIEIDILNAVNPNRAVMWNAWPVEQPRCRKRRRRLLFTEGRTRNVLPKDPWMTGITTGPPAWETVRMAAGAAAAAVASAASSLLAASDAAADRRFTGDSGDGGDAARTNGDVPQWLRRRPVGPTLYACCYSAPGIVAFDATTLLPLGILITFDTNQFNLATPEGICASHDNVFVINSVDCTIARIGLQAWTRGSGGDAAATTTRRHARYGGELPYGRGVVLATITAGVGWIGWGMALAPDGGALYCAVDLPYEVSKRQYTQVPPPQTSGNILCVPLRCLGPAGQEDVRHISANRGPLDAGPVQLPAPDADVPIPPPPAPPPPQQHPALTAAVASDGVAYGPPGPAVAASPYNFVRGEPVLRRPSGLCFSPDGCSLWVTSYDGGVVELAGPARDLVLGTGARYRPGVHLLGVEEPFP
ncbi:hypothetical protein VOLCADRAFT_95472 [Volvox carteri f. nagariensis]|uniref:Uncharacterized protein n=1 Tax=Volvox carteri f. nagariensis TaxID=3068 RepID=D8U7J8_VOLCA|nr:uncharacterized protein VOLCADRAFT_95472 [Volvox carteri f. nagariensis]EFJ44311.1 hypothetical protein VOLCADRAFT_95472 [Volvox carteri f. nagariensis]|eukprot:XP_002954670.1 hypothetical protein VOLCADRAFT_95472 [Volvox carteri f. nagariensis]